MGKPAALACVIGAGPAGDAVSRVLARAGIPHHVVDENRRPGGNIGRRRTSSPLTQLEISARSGLVELSLGVDVVDVSATRMVTAVIEGEVHRRQYDAVFICTGAYDGILPRVRADAGTISTAGALHALLKGHGIIPDGRVVIAGAGPFLWVVAQDLQSAGAEVVAVVDSVSLKSYARLSPFAALMPIRSLQWLLGMVKLKMRSVVLSFGRDFTVTESGHLLIDGHSDTVEFDRLAVSDYFAAQNQLIRTAQCEQSLSRRGFYFEASVDEYGRTSVPGIYVAGEGQGIHGHEFADVSGQLAANAWLRDLGAKQRPHVSLRLRRRLLKRYARTLEGSMYRNHGGRPFHTDAVACGCEGVTVMEVNRAIEVGLRDMTSIKSVTRAGMGVCQGKYCEPVLLRMIWMVGGDPRGGLFQKGFVRPINVEALIDADL